LTNFPLLQNQLILRIENAGGLKKFVRELNNYKHGLPLREKLVLITIIHYYQLIHCTEMSIERDVIYNKATTEYYLSLLKRLNTNKFSESIMLVIELTTICLEATVRVKALN
jgi:hypothetical protein